jgi:hypothetical protein
MLNKTYHGFHTAKQKWCQEPWILILIPRTTFIIVTWLVQLICTFEDWWHFEKKKWKNKLCASACNYSFFFFKLNPFSFFFFYPCRNRKQKGDWSMLKGFDGIQGALSPIKWLLLVWLLKAVLMEKKLNLIFFLSFLKSKLEEPLIKKKIYYNILTGQFCLEMNIFEEQLFFN